MAYFEVQGLSIYFIIFELVEKCLQSHARGGFAKWVRIKHRSVMLDFAHLGKSSFLVVIVS